MNAEQIIKDALDGLFFEIDTEHGRIITRSVPRNYMPKHFAKTPELDGLHPNVKVWTEEEDDRIVGLRHTDMSFNAIAKAVGRDVKLVRNRYEVVCQQRGLQPKLYSITRKFTKEQCDKLVELRLAGMQFGEIGPLVGMTKQQATDLYQRLRDQYGLRYAA